MAYRTSTPTTSRSSSSATNGRYGDLPSAGLVDTLRENAPIDVVGHGVQGFVNGGYPCDPNCKKSQGASATPGALHNPVAQARPAFLA